MWLLERIFEDRDHPTPRFAFLGTVNWMKSLALTCNDAGFTNEELSQLYQNVQRRTTNTSGDTLAFECLLMAMHNVDALESAVRIEKPYSFIRSGIIAWYYATYYAAKCMIAASSGSDPQTHAKTGKVWQSDIVENDLVQFPFSLSVSDLTPGNIDTVVKGVRNGNPHDLNTTPTNTEMAFGGICSYLNGTCDYEKWRIEEIVKNSSEFKNQGFENFRKKAARELRDAKLSHGYVNFLVQAFRYRGKANYRDSIYLSYGANNSETLSNCLENLRDVAKCFVLMAAHYTSRRVNREDWTGFADDMRDRVRFSMPFDLNILRG